MTASIRSTRCPRSSWARSARTGRAPRAWSSRSRACSRGEDGWLLESQLSGDRKGFQPVNAPGRKPRNGNDLYLTIDTRIQTIVDFELEAAIERYGAAGGMALVVEPATGDVLAISELPRREVSRDASTIDGFALRSINCIYEPGSTFKLVTDSYLLEIGKGGSVRRVLRRERQGTFDFGTFHDDHEYGWLSFKESFVYSSNICTIKAALAAPPAEFYRHILRLGFGGRTGIDLPAESRGTLREPRLWSARSLPSIAIGHEIGVTPLQMAMVYGALANGGELLAPRIALEERDARNSVVREIPDRPGQKGLFGPHRGDDAGFLRRGRSQGDGEEGVGERHRGRGKNGNVAEGRAAAATRRGSTS